MPATHQWTRSQLSWDLQLILRCMGLHQAGRVEEGTGDSEVRAGWWQPASSLAMLKQLLGSYYDDAPAHF
jgi:hypothetical protein